MFYQLPLLICQVTWIHNYSSFISEQLYHFFIKTASYTTNAYYNLKSDISGKGIWEGIGTRIAEQAPDIIAHTIITLAIGITINATSFCALAGYQYITGKYQKQSLLDQRAKAMQLKESELEQLSQYIQMEYAQLKETSKALQEQFKAREKVVHKQEQKAAHVKSKLQRKKQKLQEQETVIKSQLQYLMHEQQKVDNQENVPLRFKELLRELQEPAVIISDFVKNCYHGIKNACLQKVSEKSHRIPEDVAESPLFCKDTHALVM